MLQFNIGPLFKARGIAYPHSVMVKAGISAKSAHEILNDNSRSIRLDHIEILCKILVCQPNDLIEYIGDETNALPSNHPLAQLKRNETANEHQITLANIPLHQLKEIIKQINNPPE